ncbi:MAG: LCP family protein [Actinomycetota bacterium]|nr:LCP family protein [Actinomycetota bacterium]
MATNPPTSNAHNPLVAAVASAVLPGLGQWFVGDRKKARTLFIVDAVTLLILLFFFHDKVSIVTAFVRPTSLALMMITNIVILGYRVWAADDAYRSATDGGRSVSRVAGLTAILALGFFVLTPHVVFGYYDLVQYSLITTVFDGGEAAASTTITADSTSETGDTTANGEADSSSTTTTTLAEQAPWDELDRLNILLLGGDFGVGRTGIRTDTMITVSIDPKTGEAAMFQVPRNWTHAPLPEGMGIWDCNCYPELINELWIQGEQHPEAFPGPGSPSENAVKGVISEFLGIPIHYYALVNLDGFVDIIDSIGGVDIYVPARIVDDEYPLLDGTLTKLVIEQGQQHMTGDEALAYARTRHADSDYFRMNRQKCVLEAAMEQTDPTSLILNFGKFADVIKNTTTTDIPVDLLPKLVELLPAVDIDNIVSVRFIPPEYHLKYRDDGKLGAIANIDLVHEHVQLVIADPELAKIELDLQESEECPKAPEA